MIALNRYEFDSEDKASLLHGCEVVYKTRRFLPYTPVVFSQDAWVWKADMLHINNTDFLLGSWSCDNRISYYFKQAGYILYNPSSLISINHFDRLSSIYSTIGIMKGQISILRDPPPPDWLITRIHLLNVDDCIDKYTTSSSMIVIENPEVNFINSVQIQKSVVNIPYRETASAEYVECTFDSLYCLRIVDIMGKVCSKDDMAYGYPTKVRLSYLYNNTWVDYTGSFNGIPRANGNFIKRNYLSGTIYCTACRIYAVEMQGIPVMKVRLFGHTLTKKMVGDYSFVEYNSDWQKPVITEYNAYKQLVTSKTLPYNYFAFPWATLCDERYITRKAIVDLDIVLNYYKENIDNTVYATVVQHIRYIRFLELFKSLNIRYVFTPHCTLKDREAASKYGIELYGFSLYAAVQRTTEELVQSRKYLTSFIGQYDPRCYLTDIRVKIFELFANYSDCYIIRRNEWHYQGAVYRAHAVTDIDNESEYKAALAQSTFSLCPSGSGPNSIRIWESLSYGSIPVILADTLILPNIRTMTWSDAVIFWKECDIGTLYTHLKSITPEEIAAKRKAGLELFGTYFNNKQFCRVLFEEMQPCVKPVFF